jgi:hypoxanthine phosphoribosyltransferase
VLSSTEAWRILESAQEIHSADAVTRAVTRIAAEVSAELSDRNPVVLSVMRGAVIFTGQLLPQLRFPLELDAIHLSRYGNKTHGGSLSWSLPPPRSVCGRTVLVLDDILDEGETMAAIRLALQELGVARFYCAVLVDKDVGKPKPIRPDFVGLSVPNRYVFGYGMDVHGGWRNLPAIYALKEQG